MIIDRPTHVAAAPRDWIYYREYTTTYGQGHVILWSNFIYKNMENAIKNIYWSVYTIFISVVFIQKYHNIYQYNMQ